MTAATGILETRYLGAGQTIGPFTLIEALAVTGLSQVWKAAETQLLLTTPAEQLQPEDLRVCKLPLGTDLERRGLAAEMIIREAELLERLKRPHGRRTPQVVELLGRESRTPIMVATYLPGRDLMDIITEDGPLPWANALDIAQQLASIVSFAEFQRIIHHDVRPKNMRVDANNYTSLLDWGIATSPYLGAWSGTGLTFGSSLYAAPERIRGNPGTPASDVWSVGATLFCMLTGYSPCRHTGKDPDQIFAERQKSDETLPLEADVPDEVAKIVDFALAKEPHDRPSAFQLGCLMRTFLELDRRDYSTS